MKLTLLGAAGEVTGSASLLQTDRARVLVDFGSFQRAARVDDRNRLPAEIDPRALSAVLVTHAHLDHVGRLPLLARHGYEGVIHCTPATIDLAALILRDAARLLAQDVERANRKRLRAGLPPIEPSHSPEDVEAILPRLQPAPYDRPFDVAPGVRATFVEAGHILGSASIRLEIDGGGGGGGGPARSVVFSGDLGPRGAPILRDAEGFADADAVLMESTYGDRDHRPFDQTVAEFEQIIADTVARRAKILVPTFAVGRAQLLLYLLAAMFRKGTVPRFPVYLDSPMAIEATRISERHPELFDDDLRQLGGPRPLLADLDTLRLTLTAEESRAINADPGPCVILAGAGMCDGGRILHHLRQNLWRDGVAVVIVGYQATGSLGRLLVEGRKHVAIFGERVAVRARVHTLGGFSAHAGQRDLLAWFDHLAPSRPRAILNHGEARARQTLAGLLRERHSLPVETPLLGATLDL